MISQMDALLRQQYKNQSSFEAESKYYLDITNYDLKKALDEFEEDMKFERERQKKFMD